jgi:hypothetical protein
LWLLALGLVLLCVDKKSRIDFLFPGQILFAQFVIEREIVGQVGTMRKPLGLCHLQRTATVPLRKRALHRDYKRGFHNSGTLERKSPFLLFQGELLVSLLPTCSTSFLPGFYGARNTYFLAR